MGHLRWTKYILVFFITAVIFALGFVVSNRLNGVKLSQLQAMKDQIAIDTLSTETQFSLLAESSCKDIGTPVLSKELGTLGRQLSLAENNLGTKDNDVIRLKKYYSLLLIKDFMLGQKIDEKCGDVSGTSSVSILYFYSNAGNCADCKKEGYVLTNVRENRPNMRIYSFDTNLNLSAINTLKAIYNVGGELPVLVIGGKTYYGYQSQKEIQGILPPLKTATSTSATSTATSTEATST